MNFGFGEAAYLVPLSDHDHKVKCPPVTISFELFASSWVCMIPSDSTVTMVHFIT